MIIIITTDSTLSDVISGFSDKDIAKLVAKRYNPKPFPVIDYIYIKCKFMC